VVITSEQLRAARVMLKIEQADVIRSVPALSIPTLRRWEGGAGPVKGSYEAVAALQQFYEAAGIIFIAENGDGPGVRLRKPVQ
jgi:hypothetical protein